MGAQFLVTRMTMGPLVVLNFTRYTGGALAFNVAGLSRFGHAALAGVADFGATLGAGGVCASTAAHTGRIDRVKARKTFFIGRRNHSNSDSERFCHGLEPLVE